MIGPLDPLLPAAAPLLRASEALLRSLYPPESTHIESEIALARPNVTLLGAWKETTLVGCGAVKLLEDGERYGEIKRLFVSEACRGRGIGAALVAALEDCLRTAGVQLVRLETGTRQPEALRLYGRLGYAERGPFGSYGADPWSVYLEKRLPG